MKHRQQIAQQLEDVISASPALRQLQQQQLPAVLIRCMAKLGFTEPTPIQAACWPAACAGKDLQGLAEPGSGKTLAYLLPAFVRLSESAADPSGGPKMGPSASQVSTASTVLPVLPEVLILTPSRELAQQVLGQCTALFSTTGISTCCVYGGVPKEQQVLQLQQRQPRVVVATPGRLLDLVDGAVLSLQAVQYVVLDEADKMLSIGFEPQLQRLKGMLLDTSQAQAAAAADDNAAATTSNRNSKLKKRQGQAAAADNGLGNSGTGSKTRKPQVLLFTATLPAAVHITAAAWLLPGAELVKVTAGADAISRSITQVILQDVKNCAAAIIFCCYHCCMVQCLLLSLLCSQSKQAKQAVSEAACLPQQCQHAVPCSTLNRAQSASMKLSLVHGGSACTS
jgi:ATP-dependent RNA helicase DDX5/DBP2